MDLIIVTGMSGAGKSQAVNALEDMGYFCVDNVPPSMIAKFAEIPRESEGKIERIALVVDVRSNGMFEAFLSCLEDIHASGCLFKTLYLDCDDRVLLKRYKETRRRHPLLGQGDSLEKAIGEERNMLDCARQNANYVIDTTLISTSQLKTRLREMFANGTSNSMEVTCMSFGFKFGIPQDCDLMFDVRCLPNPFYIEDLRDHTGLESSVREYVMSFDAATGLARHLYNLLDYLIPLYISEGKSQLVIAIGCTGGKHRSVVFAELLARHFEGGSVRVSSTHRDIIR